VIGEILKAQETIDSIREIDRKDKQWRSTPGMKVARDVIKAVGNTVKYGMIGGDEGKGADW